MATTTDVAGGPISLDEFLAAYEGRRAEWIRGEVVRMSPVSERHQDILDFLTALVRLWVEERGGGVSRSAPYPMRLGDVVREPDLLYVSDAGRDRLRPTFLDGPADLVVEIVSPESRARDRGEKFFEYEEAGVREYWLIDPVREAAEVWRRDARGVFESVPPGVPARLASEVLPGFWIDPAWLWSQPMPRLRTVLKEWGLV